MTEGPSAITRMFLVGCPRSGTTLLQSLITAHPDVVSYPETFFFRRMLPSAEGRRRHLHLASAHAPAALRDLDALGIAADPSPPRLPSVTVSGYARRFVRRMDRGAHEQGGCLWLEKTPSHARHIEAIQTEVPGARFVHLIRAGEAVVASLKDANSSDPAVWPTSAPGELVALWRRYLAWSTPWIGYPDHAFVSYERLVSATESVMRSICEFAGLHATQSSVDAMISGYRVSSEGLVGRLNRSVGAVALATEPWKQDVAGEIGNRNEKKFNRLFSAAERQEISAGVATENDTLSRFPFL